MLKGKGFLKRITDEVGVLQKPFSEIQRMGLPKEVMDVIAWSLGLMEDQKKEAEKAGPVTTTYVDGNKISMGLLERERRVQPADAQARGQWTQWDRTGDALQFTMAAWWIF